MMKKSLMATLLAGCATSIRLATTKQFLQSGMKNGGGDVDMESMTDNVPNQFACAAPLTREEPCPEGGSCSCVCQDKRRAGSNCQMPHPNFHYPEFLPFFIGGDNEDFTNVSKRCTLRTDLDWDIYTMPHDRLKKYLEFCRGTNMTSVNQADCESDPKKTICVWDPLAANRAVQEQLKKNVTVKLNEFFEQGQGYQCTDEERKVKEDDCILLDALRTSHLSSLLNDTAWVNPFPLASDLNGVGKCAMKEYANWLKNETTLLKQLRIEFEDQQNEIDFSSDIEKFRQTWTDKIYKLTAAAPLADTPCRTEIDTLAKRADAETAFNFSNILKQAAKYPVSGSPAYGEKTNTSVLKLTMMIVFTQLYNGKNPTDATKRLRQKTEVLRNLYETTFMNLSAKHRDIFKIRHQTRLETTRGYMRLSAQKNPGAADYEEIHGLWENGDYESKLQCSKIVNEIQCRQAKQPNGQKLCNWFRGNCKENTLDTGHWSKNIHFANNQSQWDVDAWLWQHEAMKHGSVLGFKNNDEYDIEGYVNRVADLRKHWRDTWKNGTKGTVSGDEKRVDLLFLGSEDTFKNKLRTPEWMWKVVDPNNDGSHKFKGWN